MASTNIVVDSFEKQMRRAQERWKRTEDKREKIDEELSNLRAGQPVDWQAIDERSRYRNRLEGLGLITAAEAVVSGEAIDFNPLERIMGTSQLSGVIFFESGIVTSLAVGRVRIRNGSGRLLGYGTGFLISPELMMTNNHVLESNGIAASSSIQFDYLTGLAGPREAVEFNLKPDRFFVTDEDLDFTIVAVEQQNDAGSILASRGWCKLIRGSGKAVVGERVNIIQHPSGERQQIAVRDNTIVQADTDGNFLQYLADTQPGSSGSPVLNDQWELAALHHAGTPRRDDRNRILMRNGQPWTGRREDIDRIDWISNEGVRISRIVSHVESLGLGNEELVLWQACFADPPIKNLWDFVAPHLPTPDPGGRESGPSVEVDANGTVSWLFKLSFGPVSGPGMAAHAAKPAGPAAMPLPSTDNALPRAVVTRDGSIRDKALEIFERFHHEGPYYDAQDDATASDSYWEAIDWTKSSSDLFADLRAHLEQTHSPRHTYARARHEFLYPAIDLHPDGLLHNVYSGNAAEPVEVITKELMSLAGFASREGVFVELASVESLLEADELWDELEEASTLPFNCEHVVCQSWFDKGEPMRSDIHHLFACDPGCNSFRSNIPYWQFAPTEEVERDFCGRREGNKFEPEFGKGAVARATMYFLVR